MGLRHTHTYVNLAVKKETFEDVRDRILAAYPENAKEKAEHYFLHEKEFDWDTPVVGICLGEVALVVEGSPQEIA